MQGNDIPVGLRMALHNLEFAQKAVGVAMAEVNRQMSLSDRTDLPVFEHAALDAHPPAGFPEAAASIIANTQRTQPWGPALDPIIDEYILTLLPAVRPRFTDELRKTVYEAVVQIYLSIEQAGSDCLVADFLRELYAEKDNILTHLSLSKEANNAPSFRTVPWPAELDDSIESFIHSTISALPGAWKVRHPSDLTQMFRAAVADHYSARVNNASALLHRPSLDQTFLTSLDEKKEAFVATVYPQVFGTEARDPDDELCDPEDVNILAPWGKQLDNAILDFVIEYLNQHELHPTKRVIGALRSALHSAYAEVVKTKPELETQEDRDNYFRSNQDSVLALVKRRASEELLDPVADDSAEEGKDPS